MLADLGEGWTTLSLFAQNPGPFLDGDRYRVAVKGADGAPILEVERRFEYVIAQPNGPECDPTCHVASVNLYEDSPSGLTCRGARCVTFLRLITHLPDTAEASRSIVTVCRNAVCATTDNRLAYAHVTFEGELRAGFSQFSREGVFEISISMSPDPAVLGDGDVYRIRIVDSVTGAVLGSRASLSRPRFRAPLRATCTHAAAASSRWTERRKRIAADEIRKWRAHSADESKDQP